MNNIDLTTSMQRQIEKKNTILKNFYDNFKKIHSDKFVEENNNVVTDNMGNLSGKCTEGPDVCKNSEEKVINDKEDSMNEKIVSLEIEDPDYNYASDEFENDADDDDVVDNAKKNITDRKISNIEVEGKKCSVVSKESVNDLKIQTDSKQYPKFNNKKNFSCTISSSGSITNQSRRINMSFTNEKAKEIHRENHILMQKLLRTKSTHSNFTGNVLPSRESNSAISRRRKQEKTNYENTILLRKIQSAKSYNLSNRR